MSLVSLVLFLLMDMVLSYSCSSDKACIFVDNQCPFALYLQRTSIDGNENEPTTVSTLAKTKQTVIDITAWKDSPGQRFYAWWQNPIGQNLDPITYRDKVEINWLSNTMSYNPTAVDYFGLPVKIGPYDASDCGSGSTTGAYNIKVNEIKAQCPTAYEVTSPNGVCLSPQRVCWADDSNEMCSKFDTVLEECIKHGDCASDVTTTQVYACSESMSSNARLCAAINRGMYSYYDSSSDADANHSLFYQLSPYNEYAKFIHTEGAQEYAFPYDDYGGSGTSGFVSCETNFLSVTFCPGSASNDTGTTIQPHHETTTRHMSCGYIPADCSVDLTWATNEGSHSNPEWYPDFEGITGADLSQCSEEDMQLYFFCQGTNPGNHCGGLQIPCNRVCGTIATTTAKPNAPTKETSIRPSSSPISTTKISTSSGASKEKTDTDTERKYDIQDIVISIFVGFAFGVVLTLIVMVLYNMHKRKKQQELRSSLNEQLLGSISDDNAQAGATTLSEEAGQRL